MGTIAALVGVGVLLVCLVLATLGCSGGRAGAEGGQPDGDPGARPSAVVLAGEVAALDREAVRALLKKAADAPAPAAPKMGAMCYAPRAPVMRADYVCPKCGERTLYGEGMAMLVQEHLPACRRELAELKKVAGDAVTLDESQFCRKCSPEVKDPRLVLTVTFQDGKKSSVQGASAMDIRLLGELLGGKTVHRSENDGESALKEHLPRLQELLGVKPE